MSEVNKAWQGTCTQAAVTEDSSLHLRVTDWVLCSVSPSGYHMIDVSQEQPHHQGHMPLVPRISAAHILLSEAPREYPSAISLALGHLIPDFL